MNFIEILNIFLTKMHLFDPDAFVFAMLATVQRVNNIITTTFV